LRVAAPVHSIRATVRKVFPSSSPARLLLLVGATALIAATLYHDSRYEVIPPENRPIKALADGYVSSDSCRSCHQGNYSSWHASFHRTMTQVATPETLLTNMDGLVLTLDGREYKGERSGDKFFIRKKPPGGEYGAAQEVVLVTGSHTLQVPWLDVGQGRTLEQLPFAYIVAEKMWAPVNQTFLMPPQLKDYYAVGAWNGACMDCHVTHGRSRFVEGNRWDSNVAEFGIACEACHGEGHDHVVQNRNPVRRFKLHISGEADPTITNASRLKGPESALACGQCHSVWAFENMEKKIDFNRHGGAFRPGEDNLEQRFVVQPGTDDHREQKEFINKTEPDFFKNRFWGDGMIRVTGREYNGVQASPCFRGGDFSCLSCHEMHPDPAALKDVTKWRSGQLRPAMESDNACLQCHKDFSSKIAEHSHHSAASEGSRCYNCHMPHTTFGLLHAMRSHQVSSPNVKESVAYGRPNACNLCHLDKTLAWTAEKLSTWFNQTPPELSQDDQTLAASVQWIVKGDAGQRALVAWGMGWKPAQDVSGRSWLYPFLIYGMNDPYAAVRFDAWKSLQTLPGFQDQQFTYTAPDNERAEPVVETYRKWSREIRRPEDVFKPETGLDQFGNLQTELFQRLRSERNEAPIVLAE
jgi:hypothetical protein